MVLIFSPLKAPDFFFFINTSNVLEALLRSFFESACLAYHRVELHEGVGVGSVAELHVRTALLVHEGLSAFLDEVDA